MAVAPVPAPVILALDFETANQAAHSACQLAVVRIEGWRIVSSQSWLIRPPSDEFMFTDIHGITWEHVRDSPDFSGIWAELEGHFQGVDHLAAHNATFDRAVLEACCQLYQLPAPRHPYLDTVGIARKVWKIFPTKLNLVCGKLGIELKHHEALSDAMACAQILIQAQAAGWQAPALAPKAP